jgi:hypothetical protein
LRNVLPIKDIWGITTNQGHFLSKVHAYLRLGRAESMKIEQVAHQIKLLELPFIQEYRGILSEELKLKEKSQLFNQLISEFEAINQPVDLSPNRYAIILFG